MKNKKGSGLIFAVILLFVILAMVVTLSSVTVLESKMNQKTKSSVGAFYNAQSGVEYALNKIATEPGPNISSVFGASFSGGKVTCPAQYGCEVYLLDDQGIIIASDDTIDKVKAIRSVGKQDIGDAPDTQRAIEAAVASSTCGTTTITPLAVSLESVSVSGNNPSDLGWKTLDPVSKGVPADATALILKASVRSTNSSNTCTFWVDVRKDLSDDANKQRLLDFPATKMSTPINGAYTTSTGFFFKAAATGKIDYHVYIKSAVIFGGGNCEGKLDLVGYIK